MNRRSAERTASNSSTPRTSRGLLQRKCGCGSHTAGGSTCTDCAEKNRKLQRHASRANGVGSVPPIVHDVLQSSGQPLDAATRAYMEPRFGHDFSRVRASASPMRSSFTIGPADDAFEREAESVAARIAGTQPAAARRDFGDVRVHTGGAAAESARAVDAQAYTVNRDIVFGAGQYAPHSEAGRQLIAHELTHVVQQQTGSDRAGAVRRSIRGFFANLFHVWDYSPDTLQAYLKILDAGAIENDDNSDDKARQIVDEWKAGGSPYSLTAQRKALLIEEMQSGPTLDNDENAILEILERSYNYELSYIFGAGGVTAAGLDSDIDGEEKDYLKDFYSRRFDGGYEAVLAGTVKPIGDALPLGAARPLLQNSTSMGLPNAEGKWTVACALGILCSQDKAAVEAMSKLTVRLADQIVEHYWVFDGKTWVAKSRPRGAAHDAKDNVMILKVERDCPEIANDIIHEYAHYKQPAGMNLDDVEIDAYTFAEDWAIKRGLPGRLDFRAKKQGSSEDVPDKAAIEEYVKGNYPRGGNETPQDRLIGHTASGEAKVRHPDGSESARPAVAGEEHQDYEKTKAGVDKLPTIERDLWVCPEVPAKK
jgi:hypothetical protein